MGNKIRIYYLKFIYLFIIGAIALVLVDVFQLRIPNIIGKIIDGLDTSSLNKNILKDFVFDMIIIILILFLGRFLWRVAISGGSHLIEADLKKKLYNHLLEMPLEYYVREKNGSILSLFTSDSRVIRNFFGGGTLMIVDALFLGGYTLYKMIRLNLMLSLLCFIPLLIVAITSGVLGHLMNKKFLESQDAYDKLSDFASENFRGLFVIKAFARERIMAERFKKINENNKNKNLSFARYSVALELTTQILVWSIGALIIGYGGYLVYQSKYNGVGSFSVGDLTRFFSYFVTINWPMFAVSYFIDFYSQARASAKRINKLLDEEPKVLDKSDSKDIELSGNSIKFHNLTFNYPDDETPVIKGLSLEIKKGDFIGVIGKTGSGKSSLFDCMLRFYNINPNMIFIDGYDIMDIKIKNVRDLIGYVDQENFLFSDKIISNVGFSEDALDRAKAINAMKVSNVYDNVVLFSEGEDTVLGERGVSVSGGQKERIAISRAIYKNPGVLILDDSLSAVDAKTEKDIIKMIKNERGNMITILSSNRISSVKNASKILVLDNGEMVGFDTHDELLKSCQIYKEIYDLQFLDGGDIDE